MDGPPAYRFSLLRHRVAGNEGARSFRRLRQRVVATDLRGGRLQTINAANGQQLRDDIHVRVSALRRKYCLSYIFLSSMAVHFASTLIGNEIFEIHLNVFEILIKSWNYGIRIWY